MRYCVADIRLISRQPTAISAIGVNIKSYILRIVLLSCRLSAMQSQLRLKRNRRDAHMSLFVYVIGQEAGFKSFSRRPSAHGRVSKLRWLWWTLLVQSFYRRYSHERDYVTFGYLLSQIHVSSNFRQFFYSILYLGIRWPPSKILRRSFQRNPSFVVGFLTQEG